MDRNCIICTKILKGKERKFCSQKCKDKDYYSKNKESVDRRNEIWRKKNPEKVVASRKKAFKKYIENSKAKFNKLMLENYYRNKIKWRSRDLTRKILGGLNGLIKYNPLKKQCACGSVENLEIHHEEYPTKVNEIKKAIDKDKIYYKCRRCHGRRGSHKDL